MPRPLLGLMLGLIGVIMFSMTLPMTRIAVAEMSPNFVAFGRALIAGSLALCILVWRREALPHKTLWPWLALTAFGVVFGFPYFSTIALKGLPASYAAVITGLLPISTAICAFVLMRERPKPAFWFWSVLGATVVVTFAVWRSTTTEVVSTALLTQQLPQTQLGFAANLSMFAAVALGAIGYAAGARVSASIGGINTICWALVISLPINALLLLFTPIPGAETSNAAWGALAYVSVFSMFIGFFFWYNGLAIGGISNVGQIQLVQPFFTIAFASFINHESLSVTTYAVAAIVLVIVLLSRRAAK